MSYILFLYHNKLIYLDSPKFQVGCYGNKSPMYVWCIFHNLSSLYSFHFLLMQPPTMVWNPHPNYKWNNNNILGTNPSRDYLITRDISFQAGTKSCLYYPLYTFSFIIDWYDHSYKYRPTLNQQTFLIDLNSVHTLTM